MLLPAEVITSNQTSVRIPVDHQFIANGVNFQEALKASPAINDLARLWRYQNATANGLQCWLALKNCNGMTFECKINCR
jgi:hypothetical protein